MPTSPAESPARREPFLRVDGLIAGYGAAPVVAGVSLSVGAGEIVAVVGPNGAGKSTLLKALVGMIEAGGDVTLGGERITNLRSDELARRGVGFVPQSGDVFDTLSVRENLEMGGYLLTAPALGERISEVLEIFPVLGRLLTRTASKLSGGERKMLAVARALVLRPRLLLLDEPTSNLSADLARVLLHDHVRALAGAGTAVLLVEQKALAALEVADWAYVLAAGQVVLSDSASRLLAREDLGEVFLGRAAAKDAGSALTPQAAPE
jgi:ABC-type branched-subunit amino acid transport system ATPase component